jgi:hypothetical protein
MHYRDLLAPDADLGIAGAEPNGSLYERDRLLYRPGEELALAKCKE